MTIHEHQLHMASHVMLYRYYCIRDGTVPFDKHPIFYNGANEYTGMQLALVYDKVNEQCMWQQ